MIHIKEMQSEVDISNIADLDDCVVVYPSVFELVCLMPLVKKCSLNDIMNLDSTLN